MTIDQNLHQRAKAKAGRDIHKILGIISGIIMSEKLLEAGNKDEDWQLNIDKQEGVLRAFVATGRLESK